jgi:hypothetical protein
MTQVCIPPFVYSGIYRTFFAQQAKKGSGTVFAKIVPDSISWSTDERSENVLG